MHHIYYIARCITSHTNTLVLFYAGLKTWWASFPARTSSLRTLTPNSHILVNIPQVIVEAVIFANQLRHDVILYPVDVYVYVLFTILLHLYLRSYTLTPHFTCLAFFHLHHRWHAEHKRELALQFRRCTGSHATCHCTQCWDFTVRTTNTSGGGGASRVGFFKSMCNSRVWIIG